MAPDHHVWCTALVKLFIPIARIQGGELTQASPPVSGEASQQDCSIAAGAAAQANAAAASVVSALPPEVREAAAAVKGPLQQAFSQVAVPFIVQD